MTNSNLKTFDNFYADLAQSAYTYRPNNFPPDNNALDYQLFDFSRDNKFYNKEKENLWSKKVEKDKSKGFGRG